jgi:hypothetical protein
MMFAGLFLIFWALIRLSLQVLSGAGTAAAHCGGSQGRLLVAAAVARPACGLSVPSGARASSCLNFYENDICQRILCGPRQGLKQLARKGAGARPARCVGDCRSPRKPAGPDFRQPRTSAESPQPPH